MSNISNIASVVAARVDKIYNELMTEYKTLSNSGKLKPANDKLLEILHHLLQLHMLNHATDVEQVAAAPVASAPVETTVITEIKTVVEPAIAEVKQDVEDVAAKVEAIVEAKTEEAAPVVAETAPEAPVAAPEAVDAPVDETPVADDAADDADKAKKKPNKKG